MLRLPFRAAIFDLDGTLLDSIADMHLAMNVALTQLEQPTHSLDAFRLMVGEGVESLAARALPPGSPVSVPQLVTVYRQAYAETGYRLTHPFPGVLEVIAALRRAGVALAVLSNKRDDFTRDLVALRFEPGSFVAARGQRTGVPLKPNPAAALELAQMLGVPPADIAFVGDTAIDMRTAVAAGMQPVGVTWGFRGIDELKTSGARRLLNHPQELLAEA